MPGASHRDEEPAAGGPGPSGSGVSPQAMPSAGGIGGSSPQAMPSAGGIGGSSPQASADTEPDPASRDPVLADERAQLSRAREFLRLMRDDVLSLRALGGDPVSEEYLKAALHWRAEALRDFPDTPLFFGRLDYGGQAGSGVHPGGIARGDDPAMPSGESMPGERFRIGRRHVHDTDGHPVVIDWRAPVSRPFYRASQGDPMGLVRRRRFGFSGGELTAYEDEVFAADAGRADGGRA